MRQSLSREKSVRPPVLAWWSQDLVWYRARVEQGTEGESCLVTFTDYGNQDTVGPDFIVSSYQDIPADQRDMVDENVEVPDLTQQSIGATEEVPIEVLAPAD